jgi:hypothetical protein
MAIVLVRGATYADFQTQPFLRATEGDEVEVTFAPTDDPLLPQRRHVCFLVL